MKHSIWEPGRSCKTPVRFGATSVQKASLDQRIDGSYLVRKWSWHGHDDRLRDYELGPLSSDATLPAGSVLSKGGSWLRIGMVLVRPLFTKKDRAYLPSKICVSHIQANREGLHPIGLISRNWVFEAESWPELGPAKLRELSNRLGGKVTYSKKLSAKALEETVKGGSPLIADAGRISNTATALEAMAHCLEQTKPMLRTWLSFTAGFDDAHASAHVQFVDYADQSTTRHTKSSSGVSQIKPIKFPASPGARTHRTWSNRDLAYGLSIRHAIAKACGQRQAAPLVSEEVISRCASDLSDRPFMDKNWLKKWTNEPVLRQTIRYVYGKNHALRSVIESSLIIASAEADEPGLEISRIARLALPTPAAMSFTGNRFDINARKIRQAILILLKSPETLGHRESLRKLSCLLKWLKAQIPAQSKEPLIEQLMYTQYGDWKQEPPRKLIQTIIRDEIIAT